MKSALEGLESDLEGFRRKYKDSWEGVTKDATAHETRTASAREALGQTQQAVAAARESLGQRLQDERATAVSLGLSCPFGGVVESDLGALRLAHTQSQLTVQSTDLVQARREHEELVQRQRALEARIAEIDLRLEDVAREVIAGAIVVATTLTRAYLWESLRARTFDSVVLDEASMAPIPALWTAAGLAERGAVVVGDFKQLPPIVISQHPLAKKWLGRDVFDHAGCTDPRSLPPFTIALKQQYRMHPSISSVANELFYDGLLHDDPTTETKGDEELAPWFVAPSWASSRVVRLDTGSLDAWVTSVPRGGSASRLNFLSAVACVDLARLLLADIRPAPDEPRILIVCPYRPHAQLLRMLIKEHGLQDEVQAGTIHSFQGREAPVVIMDFVNDDPHWRVALFDPTNDDVNRRLLNVGLTRAQRYLFLVGDFDYMARKSKRAFLGRQLIPCVTRYPHVDAKEVLPVEILARAAEALAIVSAPPHAAPDSVVVTQADFGPAFRADLDAAEQRVIILSPFITRRRLEVLAPALRAAVDRGVHVVVVTKTLEERNASRTEYAFLEKTLQEWGITVVHKRGMHEKVAAIDEDVLWTGSLNVLSFRDTQEFMERRRSAEFVAYVFKVLRLEALVGEYVAGAPECPICGREVVASEGLNEPYYWRCVEAHCYSRSIDQAAPRDGLLGCSNCGAALKFGFWGGEATWRCTLNPRHRQKIVRSHLRLPNMRALVPRRSLRKLDRELGVDTGEAQMRLGFTVG